MVIPSAESRGDTSSPPGVAGPSAAGHQVKGAHHEPTSKTPSRRVLRGTRQSRRGGSRSPHRRRATPPSVRRVRSLGAELSTTRAGVTTAQRSKRRSSQSVRHADHGWRCVSSPVISVGAMPSHCSRFRCMLRMRHSSRDSVILVKPGWWRPRWARSMFPASWLRMRPRPGSWPAGSRTSVGRAGGGARRRPAVVDDVEVAVVGSRPGPRPQHGHHVGEDHQADVGKQVVLLHRHQLVVAEAVVGHALRPAEVAQHGGQHVTQRLAGRYRRCRRRLVVHADPRPHDLDEGAPHGRRPPAAP